ncbi:MAG: nucleoid-associated protein [Phocaeicola sp.]
MISAINSNIENCALHKIGNRLRGEGVGLSNSLLTGVNAIQGVLINYFITPFKTEEYYQFHHDSDIALNEVYTYVSKIFEEREQLYTESVKLAKHLYAQSLHPKIKSGEFYTVYFKDCILDGETVDAVGLFKSENKDTFLKVRSDKGTFNLESDKGINIKKLDKGCLIFNKESENGYVVAVVDNTNKGAEAHYWVDDFLQLRKRKDDYYHTDQLLSMTSKFVTEELQNQGELSKVEQLELVEQSLNFLKSNEQFDLDQFAQEVMKQPAAIDKFKQYKERYQQERDVAIADNFAISAGAVKRKGEGMKRIIKLDKNFQIHLNGGSHPYVEKGYDAEKGMHYYKLFFHEEE